MFIRQGNIYSSYQVDSLSAKTAPDQTNEANTNECLQSHGIDRNNSYNFHYLLRTMSTSDDCSQHSTLALLAFHNN